MKPIKLEIEGLNSFTDKQVIDFAALLRGGIFGIFGSTGSGKSTILDAISIALYGRTQKGNTKKDFINCNRNKTAVDFTFEILNEGRRRTFEFYREYNKNNTNGKALAYEIVGDGKFMLADKDKTVNELAENAVGLAFDDFKKCIALPQGEFDKFIRDTKTNRLDLMAKLFSLEKYGQRLYDAAAKRYYFYKGELENINAKLSVYSEYTAEAAAELKEKISAAENELTELLKSIAATSAEAEELKKAGEAEKERCEINAAIDKLNGEAADIAYKKECLENTDDANLLKSLFVETDKCEKKLSQGEKELKDTENLLSKAEAESKAYGAESESAFTEKRDSFLKTLAALDGIKDIFGELKKTDAEIAEKLSRHRVESERAGELNARVKRIEDELKLNAEKQDAAAAFGDVFGAIAENARAETVRDEYNYLKNENEKHGETPWLSAVISEKLSAIACPRGDFVQNIEEAARREETLKKLKEAENLLAKQLSHAKTEAALCGKMLSDLIEEGKRLRERQLADKAKIDSVTGGADYKILYSDTKNAINALDDEKKRRAETAARVAEKIKRLTAVAAEKRKENDNLKHKIEENRVKIKAVTAKRGLNFIPDAGADCPEYKKFTDFALTEQLKEVYNREVKIYGEKLAGLNARKNALPKTSFDAEYAAKRAAELNALKEKSAVVDRDAAVFKSRLSVTEKKLNEKAELEKAAKTAEARYGIAEKLQSLFRGRAFLEYVADEYLADITAAASGTLMKLTSGRYGLKYNQGFYVSDNVNGGAERSADTLSGGETFLVSLSLAFALSSAICRKSNRPIEFFFLDEGFGTLDDELVETVVDSLEKFKNSDFSIGIISHVKELKERISSRINVTAATENGGSTIEIAY